MIFKVNVLIWPCWGGRGWQHWDKGCGAPHLMASAPSPQIGPRLTLQLVKVEEGLGQGNVLYHSFGECTFHTSLPSAPQG